MKEIKITISGSEGSCGANLFVLEYEGKRNDTLLWHELIGEVALITAPFSRSPATQHIGVGKYLRT